MEFTGNINYKLFQAARAGKGSLLRRVPRILTPNAIDLQSTFQIAITTYIDRYDRFFKPLYISLKKLFPKVNILVAVNGFQDTELQKEYLIRLFNDLCTEDLGGNTFILHDKPVGLTRLWNELLSQGGCMTTLVLNDDLIIYPWFRSWINKKSWHSNITLINGSWSHFFFSKDMINRVGWFDESYRGIGFEDMDYTARCAFKGVTIHNSSCQYIRHLDHQPSRTSFDDLSSTFWGPKYSSINHDNFFQKWRLCNHDSGIYIKQLKSFIVPNGQVDNEHKKVELFFKDGVFYPDRL